MKRRTQWLYLGGCCLLLTLGACQSDENLPSREVLVQRALDKRLQKYKQSHGNRCYKNVLQRAKVLVDSTMLANARQVKVIDSIPRPPKPTKPEPPIAKSLDDTLELAPLLPLDSLDSR